MKHIKKLFIFLVLVLSFVLASCDNKKIDINITLNYGFETETKTVTYDEFDGEMLKCQRDGYKLVGWYTDNLFGVSFTSKENIKSNVNLYAKWEAIDYTISYILNGGTNNEANPATYTVESDFVLATPEKEGFSFMGWYSDYQFNTKVTRINRGSTGNITLYAKWVEDVIITFTVDGQTYNTINVTRGEEIKFPTNPTKEGYTFDGWYIGNTKVTTLPTNEAVNVIARFNINSYKVNYYKDNNLIFEEDVYYNNKASGIANNPSKDGYTFDGWYSDSSFTTKFSFEEDTIKANTNLYAKFNPIEYTITYVLENNETNSANNPAKYTIEENTITLDKATKEGYKFIGWYSDAKYQNKVETINNGSTGNITLYALFEIENYRINYELDGGLNSANNPTSYNVETETVTLESASKNGYEFKGWYLDSNFSTEIKKIEKGTTSNKTLYAKFEVVNYSITYALDGGTNNQTNPSTYTVEDEIVLADAVKEGYDFTGWMHADGAPFTKIKKGTTGAITLNATFKIKTFDVTYYYGEDKLGAEKVNYNELVGGLEANPSKTGYEFKGWYKDFQFKNEFNIKTDTVKDNINLYARLDLINYEIEYNLNGGLNNQNNPSTYTVEDEVVFQKASKEGCSFVGWVIPTGAPITKIEKGTTGKISLIATFEDDVIITFVVDNEVYKIINITNGDELKFPSVPVKEGYTFDNWYVGENVFTDLNVDASISVVAKFSPNRYKVTYYVDKTEFGSEYVEYNSYVGGLEANPTKNGYTFVGWYKEEALTTEFNVKTETIKAITNLYAKFDLVEYSITYVLEADEINSSINPSKYTIETKTFTFGNPSKEGYKFIGWFSDAKYQNKVEVINNGSTGNIELYPLFKEIVELIFKVDNETVKTIVVSDGEQIEYPTAPEKDGYDFDDWYYENGLAFALDDQIIHTTIVHAEFSPKKYEVVFFQDGNEIDRTEIEYNSYIGDLGDEPTKTGYKFVGWYKEATLVNEFDLENDVVLGNLNLYAKFEIINYSITYDLDGGTNNENNPSTYTIENEVVFEDASKEGYDFAGWMSADGAPITKIEKGTTGNQSIKATYTIKKYTVTYYNGNTECGTETVEYNSLATGPKTNPTKEHYVFVGWYKEADLKTEFDFAEDKILENTSLYAKFELEKYTITYNANGGKFGKEDSIVIENVPYGTTLSDALINTAMPTKTGYSRGYFKIGNEVVENTEMDTFLIEGNITIIQEWYLDVYDVYYNNLDGATNSKKNPDTFTVEELPRSLDGASKTGYDFVGWYQDLDDATTKVETLNVDLMESLTSGQLDLYAKFEVHNYSIEYVLNGGTNDKDNPSTYNVLNYVDLKGATKEGYRFDGWYDNANFDGDTVDLLGLLPGVQLEDVVLYAKFTKIITITFKVDGNVTETINVHDGDKLELPADPTKDHYVFDGWYNGETKVTQEALTKINESTELKAKWTVEKYTVSYFVKGEEKPRETEIVEYNNLATGPKASIEKDGYYFDGWYSNESCTDDFDLSRDKITDDIDLYGQFVELSDDINVLEIVGANEVAYLKIAIANGYTINDYKVSYLLNNDFVSINSNLVRFIDENSDGKNDYVRADILGLKAGKYTVKVELGEASTTKNIVVSAQDRSGYAHFNYPNGVGAYNNDGTLKDNAVVVYVNEQNKNTVEATIGGKTKTGISAILQAATTKTPVDVRIIGTVGAATWKPLTVSSYSSASTTTVRGANGQYLALQNYDERAIINGGFNELDETIYSKLNGLSNKIKYDSNKQEFDSYYNMLDISNAQNVTVEGVGDDARIFQWGFTWKSCTSIEVKNLTFDDYTEDACSFEGNDDSTTISGFTTGHLWIHHNTFERGVNYWDVCSEQDKHDGDGATDFKKLANVTIAYNHYINNHKTGLVGGSDTQHTACLTFHHNFYDTCQARLPFARQANMHMYNNYYYNSTGNNMQIYAGAYAFIENCYFKNTKNTFSLKTSDGKVAAVKSFNNIFDSCQSTGATIVTSRTEAVTNGNLYGQTFDTNSTIFYYDAANEKSNVSIMNEAEDVPAYVALHAGAGSGYYLSLNLYEEPVESFNVTFNM